MCSIILPYLPRRAWLISFWLVAIVGSSLLIAIVSWYLDAPQLLLFGVLLLVLALAGALWPQIVPIPYRVWNKLAGHYAEFARLCVLVACYYVVFTVVGRMGSSLVLNPQDSAESLWVPRQSLPSTTYGSQYRVSGEFPALRNWIISFVSWAFRSGNIWAVFILPFFVLV